MTVKNQDLVKVWDGKELIEENIQFLKTPTKKVDFPLSENIKSIISDLIDTYKATPCAGIAANQIGYNKSIFIGMEYDDRPVEGKDDGQDLDEVERDDMVQILDAPSIPTKLTSPRRNLSILLSFFFGIFTSIFMISFRENYIETKEEQ